MDKLDKAIAAQERALSECETDLMTKRKIWEGMHHRTQSLQKVCNSALAAEIKKEGKREQLEQDERVSRSARNIRWYEKYLIFYVYSYISRVPCLLVYFGLLE